MRRLVSILLAFSALFALLLVGCEEEPAYMHPYGPGVDPDTVVTKPYTPVTTTTSTTGSNITTTTTMVEPPPETLNIPEGHILCPECQGVKLVCSVCFGTDRCKLEIFDQDSGVFVRKLANCVNCSEEDPGYMLCRTCMNTLYIPEE